MFDREGDHSYLHIPSYHMCLPLEVGVWWRGGGGSVLPRRCLLVSAVAFDQDGRGGIQESVPLLFLQTHRL